MSDRNVLKRLADVDRRDFMKYVGIGSLAGLAGCGSGGQTGDGSPAGTSMDTDTPTPTESPTPTPTPTPSKLGETLVGPDGEQVTLKAVYSTGQKTTETTMEFIKQELGKVGVKVELTGVQFPTMLARYAQNSMPDSDKSTFNAGPRDKAVSQKAWDLMGGIGFNSYPRTPTSIRPFWTDVSKDTATVNFYGYKPSEPIGPKLDTASSTTDDQERQELLSTVFGILSRDQPTDFLTFSTNLDGFRARVNGLGESGPSFGYNYQNRYFGSGEPSVGGTYTDGTSAGAKTLNPIRINDTSSAARLGLLMDGAYTLDNENEFTPRWVSEVQVGDKKQNYEFFLQDNLQWGAGFGQMTADDWIYYIQEVHQAEDNWAGDVGQSDWFRNGEPIPVEKTGKLSFEIQLPETDPFFIKKPVMWGAQCLPKGLVQEYRDVENGGEKLNRDARIQEVQYAGNLGPYSFERWERQSVFVASRNDDYYAAETVFDGDVPYFEQNKIQVFSEESTRLSALRTGEIDHTSIPPAKLQQFEENEDVNVVKSPTAFCGMLVYNQRANGWEEFRKRKVRQAFSTAISKRVIAEQINRGTADMAFTHQPEYSRWYDDSKVVRFGGPDSTSIPMAQRMLDEALPSGYSFEG